MRSAKDGHGSPRRVPRHTASPRERGNATVNGMCLAGVVGLAMLGNPGPQYDVRQTTYGSREDCLKDWGTEESCAAVTTPNGTGSPSYYTGPRYYWDTGRNRPVVIGANGAVHDALATGVTARGGTSGRTAIVGSFARGGFGGIGRGFSSGRGG